MEAMPELTPPLAACWAAGDIDDKEIMSAKNRTNRLEPIWAVSSCGPVQPDVICR